MAERKEERKEAKGKETLEGKFAPKKSDMEIGNRVVGMGVGVGKIDGTVLLLYGPHHSLRVILLGDENTGYQLPTA